MKLPVTQRWLQGLSGRWTTRITSSRKGRMRSLPDAAMLRRSIRGLASRIRLDWLVEHERNLPNEVCIIPVGAEDDVYAFSWYPTPRWAQVLLFRKKWFRRIYNSDDRVGWQVEYATDAEVTREYLEKTFDRENQG